MRVVVLRSTGPQNNPKHFTPEFCASLLESDAIAYQTNVLGEFADQESGLLSPVAIATHTRDTPLELTPEHGGSYGGAVDVGKDRLTVVLVQPKKDEQALTKYRVVLAYEAQGGTPDSRWEEVARRCHRYGVEKIICDQYAAEENIGIARRLGLRAEEIGWSQANRLEAFTNLATILHAGRIELAPERQLRADLLAVKKRLTANGATIILPRTRDGRHADYAPALAAALRAATKVLRLRAQPKAPPLSTFRSVLEGGVGGSLSGGGPQYTPGEHESQLRDYAGDYLASVTPRRY